jgi:hypothetical protein
MAEIPIDPARLRISDEEEDVITLPPDIRINPAIYYIRMFMYKG